MCVHVRLAVYCGFICKYVWRLDEMMMVLEEDLCYTGDQLCYRKFHQVLLYWVV